MIEGECIEERLAREKEESLEVCETPEQEEEYEDDREWVFKD